jgi:hypothetical protein
MSLKSNVFHDLKNLRKAQRSLKICQFWPVLATFYVLAGCYATLRVFTKKKPKKISKKFQKKIQKKFQKKISKKKFKFFSKYQKTGLPKLLRMS